MAVVSAWDRAMTRANLGSTLEAGEIMTDP